VVQPNASRAQTFGEAFISCGGIETLLVLLQREAKSGDQDAFDSFIENDDKDLSVSVTEMAHGNGELESSGENDAEFLEETKVATQGDGQGGGPLRSENKMDHELLDIGGDFGDTGLSIQRTASENLFVKNVGGINLPISADNARNNAYNFDRSDGIVVGIIKLLGTLVTSGYLKFNSSAASPDMTNSAGLPDSGGSMFDDKVSLLLFALQKAFQAAPRRLLTRNVYTTLLAASVGHYLFVSFQAFLFAQ